ncbi:MAG TPA: hypothetical protein VD968_04790 [Pyrinomonadaceae bacterium]|nr:hypothetical protein [Pyrinomonadaceae bacterium]
MPYLKDQCLVLDELSGYREAYDGGEGPPMKDGVTAWQGTRMLWRAEAPPGAELQASGEKIFAVTKTSSKVLIEEVRVPQGAR